VDPKGYINRVEFYANGALIGVSQIVFVRAPEPGTPIRHALDWRGVVAGSYVITAQARDTDGTLIAAAPLAITVLPPVAPTADVSSSIGRRVVFQNLKSGHYSIQVSGDLMNWAEIGTLEASGVSAEFIEEGAEGDAQRFYRALPREQRGGASGTF
jgi:hypothetical protein